MSEVLLGGGFNDFRQWPVDGCLAECFLHPFLLLEASFAVVAS